MQYTNKLLPVSLTLAFNQLTDNTNSKESVDRAYAYLYSSILGLDRDNVPTARQPLGIEYDGGKVSCPYSTPSYGDYTR